MSINLSSTQSGVIEELAFVDLVRKEFQPRLRQLPQELREQEVEKLFSDLRSSATLTRRSDNREGGWRFSHNSLREFLAAQYLVSRLNRSDSKVERIRVSDAMKLFVLSLPEADRLALLDALRHLVGTSSPGEVVGMYLSLVWDAGLRLYHSQPDPVSSLLKDIAGSPISLNEIVLHRLSFFQNNAQANLQSASFANASLTDLDLSSANLSQSSFRSSLLEGVSFRGADLRDSDFDGAMLIEVDFTDSNFAGANFRNLADYSGIRTATGVHNGEAALGYIAFKGGQTDKIPALAIAKHHPHHPIAEKIARKLTEQNSRQERGLTQRGTANKDPLTAKKFLRELKAHGLVEQVGGRSGLVRSTEKGRPVLKAFCEDERLDPSLFDFFDLQIKPEDYAQHGRPSEHWQVPGLKNCPPCLASKPGERIARSRKNESAATIPDSLRKGAGNSREPNGG